MNNRINEFLGVDLSPTVSFILLFAAIIVGVLLLIWIARRLLGGTFVSGGRGRHLRLAVMDATPVDSRRRLVLVRRDDVEHLILIGGPTDVVVEHNIRIDGQREPRNSIAPKDQRAPSRPVEQTNPPEAPRPAPTLQPQAAPLPLPLRPAPVPQPPAAPYSPPRPVIPPSTTFAPVTRPMPTLEPRPFAQAPRVDPSATAMASSPTLGPLLPTAAKPVEPVRPVNDDLDESLLADLSESLSHDEGEIAPEVSLEKEMESLLGTLDPKKDRLS
jgi:flagellar biogenesis protein FliO